MTFESTPQMSAAGKELNKERRQNPEKLAWQDVAWLTDRRSEIIDTDVRSRIHAKHPDYDFDRLHPQLESYEHGQLDIQFVGVKHRVETLAAHRQAIEVAIADADIVVLEGSVGTSGAEQSSRVVNATSLSVPGRTKKVNMNIPEYAIDTNSGLAFFSEVENIARKHRKPLVLFDPFSDRRLLQSHSAVTLQGGISHEDRLDTLNERIRQFSEAIGDAGEMLATGALTGVGAEAVWREKIKLMIPGGINPDQIDQSRREFMKHGVAYAAGVGLGITAMVKAKGNQDVIDYATDPDRERISQYNLTDFRDVSIATGLDRLGGAFHKKMKTTVIYGAYHANGVRKYLENPRLREVKMALYKPFREIAPPEMTAYRYELAPEVVSGKKKVQDIAEHDWGCWKQTIQLPL
ncbi:MAG: hypothetical protein IPJ68_05930 [Candidatus Moraniibacteriota bacterium]|nr:MAG: hypothetical protein IPJ68_05930 [Candidatus Moranbacteria bacterium]